MPAKLNGNIYKLRAYEKFNPSWSGAKSLSELVTRANKYAKQAPAVSARLLHTLLNIDRQHSCIEKYKNSLQSPGNREIKVMFHVFKNIIYLNILVKKIFKYIDNYIFKYVCL